MSSEGKGGLKGKWLWFMQKSEVIEEGGPGDCT